RIPASTGINVLGSVIGAVLACGGTYAFGVRGQLAATAAAALLTWPLSIVLAQRAYPSLRMTPRPRIRRDVLRAAFAVGASMLLATLAQQLSLSATRWALDRHGGTEANGQFQAAWLIGTNYLTVVLGSLGSVIFPRYAAAQDPEALAAIVDEAGHFVMRV